MTPVLLGTPQVGLPQLQSWQWTQTARTSRVNSRQEGTSIMFMSSLASPGMPHHVHISVKHAAIYGAGKADICKVRILPVWVLGALYSSISIACGAA